MGKPHKPPSASGPVLDSIASLLAHPRTKPVPDTFSDTTGNKFLCVLPGGQLYFESPLELDTDGSPFSAHAIDPKGNPETTATDAAGNFLNATFTNFFVLPKDGFDSKHGIKIGDIAVVISARQVAYACYVDRGPAKKLGEGSIALHRALGHDVLLGGGRLLNAGIDSGVITIVFPGSGNGFGRSNDESAAIGEPLFQKLNQEGFAYEMQVLAGLRSRQITIPATRGQLEPILLKWVQELVDNTSPPTDIDGQDPARFLLATAEGVDTLLYAPPAATPMAVAGQNRAPPPQWTVYADFTKAQTPAGRWYVRHIKFHLNPQEQAAAEKAQADDARE